jgi:hypothetical protein
MDKQTAMTSDSPYEAPAQPSAPAAEQAVPEAVETAKTAADLTPAAQSREYGGRKDGTEPTRYGDWEKHGRCIDF